jgi:hypothetical protein
MSGRSIAVGIAALAGSAALMGCGGSDSKDKAASGPATTTVSAADAAQAKSDARTAATVMESCFVDSQDYSVCGDDALANSDLEPGTEPGQVHVAQADAQSYRVEAYAAGDATFAVVKSASGELTRECTGDGCAADTW